jgi:hypothetical protein
MRLTYKPGWDLATIPDDLLYRESGRRMAVGRRVSRPKKLSPCPHCGEPKGVGEMRTHAPVCKRIHNGTYDPVRNEISTPSRMRP